jgi:hypothetical protein
MIQNTPNKKAYDLSLCSHFFECTELRRDASPNQDTRRFTIRYPSNRQLLASRWLVTSCALEQCMKKITGDFEEVYGGDPDPREPQAGHWDAILTCFFIDTVGQISFSLITFISCHCRLRTS